MIEYVTSDTKEEEEKNPFEEYFEKQIQPELDSENSVRHSYQSRFWGLLWSAIFINSANVLFILYQVNFKEHSLSLEQIFMVLAVSLLIVAYPMYSYGKRKKCDYWDKFIKYYHSEWQHTSDIKNEDNNLFILPPYDKISQMLRFTGTYLSQQFSISEVNYSKELKIGNLKFNMNKGKGLRIDFSINNKLPAELIMYDSSYSYKRRKMPGYSQISNPGIPASNYFYLFCNNEEWAKEVIRASLYERLLDLKMALKAENINIQYTSDSVSLFVEDVKLYTNIGNFWKCNLNKEYFLDLNKKIDAILEFMEITNELTAEMKNNA